MEANFYFHTRNRVKNNKKFPWSIYVFLSNNFSGILAYRINSTHPLFTNRIKLKIGPFFNFKIKSVVINPLTNRKTVKSNGFIVLDIFRFINAGTKLTIILEFNQLTTE